MITLSGVITRIFETKEFNNFPKRVFWLDDKAEKFGNEWELMLWKKDVEMIDNYKVGDFVTVYIDIKGSKWVGRDGEERVTNTLKCWNIEKDGQLFKPI